jgi:hypothetical protein
MRCRGQVVEQAPRSQRKEERYGALDYFTHQRDGGHDWHRNDKASCDEGYSAHLIAREAAQFIRASKQPFFLYVPFNAVHAR